MTWTDGVEPAIVLLGMLAGGWLLGSLRPLPSVAAGLPPVGAGTTPLGPVGAVGRVAVSVVVPARDEAAVLPALLASLRALHPAPLEVIVVDDGSTDGTAEVAARAGATVLTSPPLPPGWAGKPWACHVGAEHARGDTLLFLDADTWLSPDALARLLRLQHSVGRGLVTVQPRHEVPRAYEQLSAYFNLVSMMASGAFAPRQAHTSALAYGPCLLTSREDYLAAGGHHGVRAEVLDDIQLAKAYGRRGLRVHCRVGGDAVRMRSYPGGLGQLLQGWTKNIAAGAGQSALAPALGTALWVYAGLLAALDTVWELSDWVAGRQGLPVLWLALWVAVAAQLQVLLRRIGTFRWWTAAVFPVPLLAFVAVFAGSAFATAVRRQVTWRGRTIATGRRAA